MRMLRSIPTQISLIYLAQIRIKNVFRHSVPSNYLRLPCLAVVEPRLLGTTQPAGPADLDPTRLPVAAQRLSEPNNQ